MRVVPVTGGARIGRSLTYGVPVRFRKAMAIGSVVAVPVRTLVRIGVVVAFEEKDEADVASPYEIRDIQAVFSEEALLGRHEIETARWMASYYACGLSDALIPFTPEIRALSATKMLVAPDAERIEEAIASLGLLFAGSKTFDFEPAADGGLRVVRSELEDALKSGGLDSARIDEIIKGWIKSGVIREEIGIRTRVRHLGKESYLVVTSKGKEIDYIKLKSARQAEILRVLRDVGGILSREELVCEVPSAQSGLVALVKKGLIEEIVDSSLLPSIEPECSSLVLSAAQTVAVREISKSLDAARPDAFLLFGITGSGKTEVYVEVCKKALSMGKKATVLVPEIALTHQAVRRFMQMFPRRVALLHSELTERERLHEWRDVRRGKRDIVIGARSALFVPVPDRALIIIDEESETAYKQQQRPRYHAREVARRMSKAEGSVMVMGSATPAVETYYAAKKGIYKLLNLPARVVGGALPEVKIVCPDIVGGKEADEERGKISVDGRELPVSLLSSELREELRRTLDAGRQAMLFLNLRAFARTLICGKCGWVARCPGCEISLAYHRREHAQVCHHCGYREPARMVCGKCGHDEMRFLGFGTERLEAEVRALFPSARLARMDRDTVSTRGRRKSMVEAMRKGEVDFLVGTQMIAKGLDFPAVRLVGVISADQSLHIPDFRASERTFQLITQVIGRAGRSDDLEREGGGIAIIQSYDPENRVLQTACSQDFESFFENEIQLRLRFGYPPATHIARIVVSGADKEAVIATADTFADALGASRVGPELVMLGPAPAPFREARGQMEISSDP